MTTTTTGVEAQQVRDEAERILPILRRQRSERRPFVIELAGTPKAGKSTAVHMLQRFFESCGYRTHVVEERAAACPLPMKGHFFFNAWTTCTMLAQVLEVVDRDLDIVILDRGFFDSLVWLERQKDHGMVTADEARIFSDFVRLERWRSLANVSLVLTVDEATAMAREHGSQLIPRNGSLMNEVALREFNVVQERVLAAHSKDFRLHSIHAKPKSKDVVTTMLREAILPALDGIADPEILSMPEDDFRRLLPGTSTAVFGKEATGLLASIESALVPRKRSELESDTSALQLVACGVFEFESKYLVLERRKGDKKFDDFGQHTLWKGCHVTANATGTRLISNMRDALLERIQEDLHLAKEGAALEVGGMCWEGGRNHVGVIFRVTMPNADVANAMVKKYRRSGREEPVLRGGLEDGSDILQKHRDGRIKLEPWSRCWLEEVTK